MKELFAEIDAHLALDRARQTLYEERPGEVARALEVFLQDNQLSPRRRWALFRAFDYATSILSEAKVDLVAFAKDTLAYDIEKQNRET